MIVAMKLFMYMSMSWVSSKYSSMLLIRIKKFNIKVLKSCITDKPPKLLVAPPSTVWAVQGENVTIKALYKGDFDDISEGNLLAYWRITTLDSNTRYIYPTNNYTSYYVTTDRCLPTDCCYFTVSIEIKSLTLDLSQANVSSAVVWLDDLNSFNPGNSTLGMNVLLEYYNCVSIRFYCSCVCVPYPC